MLAWFQAQGGIKDTTICDCGCGTGSLAVPLALNGAAVTASDISASMVQEAERRYKEALSAGGTPPATAPVWEATDLESASGKYEVVTCLDVMIHYPQVSAATWPPSSCLASMSGRSSHSQVACMRLSTTRARTIVFTTLHCGAVYRLITPVGFLCRHCEPAAARCTAPCTSLAGAHHVGMITGSPRVRRDRCLSGAVCCGVRTCMHA